MVSVLGDPVVVLAGCGGLALLFSEAALHKLRAPQAFAAVLDSYGILPALLQRAAVPALPACEFAIAAGLVFPLSRRLAALAAALLLLAYALAMGITLLRGARIADCGCGFGRAPQRVGSAMVWRNAVLACIALILALPMSARPSGMLDWVFAALAGLAACAMYALCNALIDSHHSTRDLFHD